MLLYSTARCAASPLCRDLVARWPVHNSWRGRRGLPSIHRPIRLNSTTCRSVLETASVMAGHSDDPVGVGSWPSLLLTCALMFLGAYGCGTLPRWLPNQNNLTASVTAVGAGLLLGSALCIILPEGFEAAMEGDHHPPSWAVAAALLSGFWLMLALDSLSHWFPALSHSHGSSSRITHRSLSDPETLSVTPQDVRVLHGSQNPDSSDEHTVLLTDFGTQQDSAASGEPLHDHYTPGWRPGSSPTKSRAAARSSTLPSPPATSAGGAASTGGAGGSASAGGSVPAGASGRWLANAAGSGSGGVAYTGSASGTATTSTSADGLVVPGTVSSARTNTSSSGRERVPPAAAGAQGSAAAGKAAGDAARPGAGVHAGLSGPWWQQWLVDPTHHALLGLLVHAVSDGLAVGAASLSTVPQVSLGVATAMVVHKGPVAIGLATFLQGAAWSSAQVHRGVLLFALASPLAALLTFGFLTAVPGIADNIPLVVLFSGGTVLYAATMHILPGAMRAAGSKASQQQHHLALDRQQLLLVTLGMVLPLILSAVFSGHHHHHHA